ncbi:hypothetical protein V7S43_004431 [Phytophthora oleae]|uniref:Uncharacterized protein n=1 Tax=Phytophthora oleae TaxID=2107226 RepID=A0ABD3FWQ9_9STRA
MVNQGLNQTHPMDLNQEKGRYCRKASHVITIGAHSFLKLVMHERGERTLVCSTGRRSSGLEFLVCALCCVWQSRVI